MNLREEVVCLREELRASLLREARTLTILAERSYRPAAFLKKAYKLRQRAKELRPVTVKA